MQFDFLQLFPRRMKTVARYACLCQNSFMKTTWSRFGFESAGEQMNLLFGVLLYIMERSLAEVPCTIDDIAVFTDEVSSRYFGKSFSYEDAQTLADFMVNTILSNDGEIIHFPAYSFEKEEYEDIHVSYVETTVVYMEGTGLRRTSYKLTNDGYNLLLGTMEIEDNMKLTVQEMIFELQLERKSYDKAEEAIKNVYMQVRVQIQKIGEDMNRIRRNPLGYTTEDYRTMLTGNLETIEETRHKFENYRTMVAGEAQKLEEAGINIRELTEDEHNKLTHLKNIGSYLSHVLEDYQQILLKHFDLKNLYAKQLSMMTQMSMIRRFSIRSELYEKILSDATLLDNLDLFLAPLFSDAPDKIYNPNLATTLQRPSRVIHEDDREIDLDFDEEAYRLEKERELKAKKKRYEMSLRCLLRQAGGREDGIRISELEQDSMRELIPNVEVFKEVMIELIKVGEMDLDRMRTERELTVENQEDGFRLGDMLLDLTDKGSAFADIHKVEAYRIESAPPVVIEHVMEPDGRERCIRCSDVLIRVS